MRGVNHPQSRCPLRQFLENLERPVARLVVYRDDFPNFRLSRYRLYARGNSRFFVAGRDDRADGSRLAHVGGSSGTFPSPCGYVSITFVWIDSAERSSGPGWPLALRCWCFLHYPATGKAKPPLQEKLQKTS